MTQSKWDNYVKMGLTHSIWQKLFKMRTHKAALLLKINSVSIEINISRWLQYKRELTDYSAVIDENRIPAIQRSFVFDSLSWSFKNQFCFICSHAGACNDGRRKSWTAAAIRKWRRRCPCPAGPTRRGWGRPGAGGAGCRAGCSARRASSWCTSARGPWPSTATGPPLRGPSPTSRTHGPQSLTRRPNPQ